MADIAVDTYRLNQYARQLKTVNRKIQNLDSRMNSLYTKVGLADLLKLLQADALTGYSWRLIRCAVYLESTAEDFEHTEKKLLEVNPADFDKPPVAGVTELIYDVGAAVKKGASGVKSFVEKKVHDVLVSYYTQGTVYRYVQYGKAVLKTAYGVAKVAGALGVTAATCGVTGPVAVLQIIAGANEIINGVTDLRYTYEREYEKIGKTNFLKDTLVKSGEEIGKRFNNDKIGKAVGNAVYVGVNLVSALTDLKMSYKAIKNLPGVNVGNLGKELKEISKINLKGLMTTEFETIRYHAKLASYTFTETTKVWKSLVPLMKVGGDAVKIGKSLNDIYAYTYRPDWKNPVLECFDNISDINSKVHYTIKSAMRITKFVFG